MPSGGGRHQPHLHRAADGVHRGIDVVHRDLEGLRHALHVHPRGAALVQPVDLELVHLRQHPHARQVRDAVQEHLWIHVVASQHLLFDDGAVAGCAEDNGLLRPLALDAVT
jgi:hypothetical protein